MLFQLLKTFIGIDKIPSQAHGLIYKFLLLTSIATSLFLISRTFYVLFVIEIIGFPALTVLLAISLFIQVVLDYPSGVLGDWLGQKWILGIAYTCYGMSYLSLITANTFSDLIIVYVLSAVAESQESGALQSWFDNNFKKEVNLSSESREIYREFQGKYQSIVGLLGAGMFVVGGIIATALLREVVFLLQAIGMFVLVILCLSLIQNSTIEKPEKRTLSRYFSIIGEGIRFSIYSKQNIFIILGICLWGAIWKVWVEVLLIPIYFGYTGSDIWAGSLRFLAWVITSLLVAKAGIWSKHFPIRSWIPRFNFLIITIFFGYFVCLLMIFPLEEQFSFLPVLLILIIVGTTPLFIHIYLILRQQLLLDLVPDTIRTSIYSLIPTISLIFGIPLLLVAGNFIELFGFSSVLLLLIGIGVISTGFLLLGMFFLPKGIIEWSSPND